MPYSGRIAHGRFSFAGREVQEPPNFAPSPHAIHGHGWTADWRVEAASATAVTLGYEHVPASAPAWPWRYYARQRFALTAGQVGAGEQARLDVELTLTNRADSPMPAGLGLHPYLPRAPDAQLTARVAGVWDMDSEVMPTGWRALEDMHPLLTGLDPDSTPLDNAFTGFAGGAHVEWPSTSTRLDIEASIALGHLVVFTPPGEDYFCVEPVSHMPDAFNRAERGETHTGMQALAPGETFAVGVAFEAGVAPS